MTTGCDDEDWCFVNGQHVRELHDWPVQPIFDINGGRSMNLGDNVIAAGLHNVMGSGGLNPNATAKIIGGGRPAVVTPAVTRPGASHRPINMRCRRYKIDGGGGGWFRACADDGLNATVQTAGIGAVSRWGQQKTTGKYATNML